MNIFNRHFLLIAILYTTLLIVLSYPFLAQAQNSPTNTPTINSGANKAQLWVSRLEECESQNRPNITILDSNNKYSYGLLMFQLQTFINFGKKYNILPDELTSKEALLLIHNSSIQKAIATDMLEDGLQNQWYNCSKKLGKYPTSDSS